MAQEGARADGPRSAPRRRGAIQDGTDFDRIEDPTVTRHSFHTVAVLLPALNEAEAIGQVLDELPLERLRSTGYIPRVVIVDGHSTDATADIARSRGIEILQQMGSGKGWAVRTAFQQIQSDYLVMLDADFTYPGDRIPAFLDQLDHGADIVLGSRLRGSMEDGAMRPINVLGNKFLSFLASTLYGHRVSDVCSGMWAFGPRTRKALTLNSEGFEVEAEIFAQGVKQGLRVVEMPIPYRVRVGVEKLGRFHDGISIAAKLVRKRFAP